jgi:hypothetical protein
MYKNEANCETGEITLILLTDEEIAEREAIAAEIAARPPYVPTIQDKLARAGLNLDELKEALGL